MSTNRTAPPQQRVGRPDSGDLVRIISAAIALAMVLFLAASLVGYLSG